MTPAAINQFVEDWQRGDWSVAGLPSVINARVYYFGSGDRLLGLSEVRSDQWSAILLNARLIGTPYYTPVLAHECAHVLMEEDGLYTCYAGDRHERAVWDLAARLAVPSASIAALHRGDICADGLARIYELPEAFVRYATAPAQLPAWLDSLVVPPPPPMSDLLCQCSVCTVMPT